MRLVRIFNVEYLNADAVARLIPMSASGPTAVHLMDGSIIRIDLPVAEVIALLDPENPCTDGPATCGYHDYLGARRADEAGDMSHAGYHAARTAGERHSAGCTKWNDERVCSICLDFEQRLRA